MSSKQGELEFKNEVVLMVKLQHINLVRLLGFSLRGAERLLVYEFVQNGSLDCSVFGNFLFHFGHLIKNILILLTKKLMYIYMHLYC